MRPRPAWLAALAAAACLGAAAGDPSEVLRNPVQEARARSLFRQIRCLVCQNESIDDSEAPLADDLRGLVREQIVAGRSDAQIKAYLVSRYNEFVLMRPTFSPANAVLWLSPFAVVLVGGAVLLNRRGAASRGQVEARLSEDEENRLRDLVGAPISLATVRPHDGQISGPGV